MLYCPKQYECSFNSSHWQKLKGNLFTYNVRLLTVISLYKTHDYFMMFCQEKITLCNPDNCRMGLIFVVEAFLHSWLKSILLVSCNLAVHSKNNLAAFNHTDQSTKDLSFLAQVWVNTEALRTSSSTRPGFKLMTSRSWQYISCHWDACSNHGLMTSRS